VGQDEAADAVTVRGLRYECIALIGGRLRKMARVKLAIHSFQNFSPLVEPAQLPAQRRRCALAGNIGLGDDQPVGKDRLFARLRGP
jgi:hypothetical protein